MKKLNKVSSSFLVNIKSNLLIIYTEYLSSFFLILFVLISTLLLMYYLYLFITSSQKEKLSNLTTILSFVVGFFAIRYQINKEFMREEETSIIKINDQLNYVYEKGRIIYANAFNIAIPKNTISEYKHDIKDALKMIDDQQKNCLNARQLIHENINMIVSKTKQSKISILDRRLRKTDENLMKYQVEILLLSITLNEIDKDLSNFNLNEDISSFKLKEKHINNLQSSDKRLQESLKAKEDLDLLYGFLNKYNN